MGTAQGKIVICFPFIGDLVGGSHLSALGLIRNLDRRRYHPLVVLHRTDGPLAELLRNEKLAFEAAPVDMPLDFGTSLTAGGLYQLLRTIPQLTSYIRRQHVDIVHTNDGSVHTPWGLAARLAGAKLLWHHRSNPGSHSLRRIAPIIAHRVVAVSKFASPRPGWYSAARKCTVVYSPFDTGADVLDRAASRDCLVNELGCAPETKLLGYVGALVDRKRPVLFVETIAALRRMNPNLEIAGIVLGESRDGFDQRVTARAAELGMSDRIHILGFRYPVEPWLAALDALLVTAVDEPLGRTLVEAMLLGTPLIATSSGGNPEAIRHEETGLLVQPDAPDAFAEAVIKLICDPTLEQAMTRAARDDARARFSIESHVHSITQIYEELVCRTSK